AYPPIHHHPGTATSITTPTSSEAEIRPCIAELLRTGYHPSELILRVERVIEVLFTPSPGHATGTTTTTTAAVAVAVAASASASARPNRRSYRVFLSDGEFVIQALLAKALHRFALAGEVAVGSVMRLERFELRKGERIGGSDGADGAGQVMFLAVEGFRCLTKKGVGERGTRVLERGDVEVRVGEQKRKKGDQGNEDGGGGGGGTGRGAKAPRISDADGAADISGDWEDGFLVEDSISDCLSGNLNGIFDSGSQMFEDYADSGNIHNATKDAKGHPGVRPGSSTSMQEQERSAHLEELSTANISFSNSPLQPEPPETIKQEPSSSSHTATQNLNTQNKNNTSTQLGTATHSQFKLPGILEPVSRPLNLHTLSQLLHPAKPLPKRNYLCDVLAVISWISPDIVKRPQMPPKRDLRIMDPTITSHKNNLNHALQQRLGVSVSVFVDAAAFSPPVGTVGLFRCLKTHEWEGVSLNAYEKDCKGREWFVCEPGRLRRMLAVVKKGEGVFDVEEMEEWWRTRCQEEKKKEEEEEEPGRGNGRDGRDW
ncbi:RPA1_DBD superfamily domain-containing protein, partial [Histoplasma capsulatum]